MSSNPVGTDPPINRCFIPGPGGVTSQCSQCPTSFFSQPCWNVNALYHSGGTLEWSPCCHRPRESTSPNCIHCSVVSCRNYLWPRAHKLRYLNVKAYMMLK
jgi:hypothetical protein